MTTLAQSARNRRNRAKGNEAERAVAKWLRPWFPDCCRAVRNTVPDPGDLDCTGPGLYWSVKNSQREHITAWMDELRDKARDRLGLLVVRRKGRANPGEWWCWLRLVDLSELFGGVTDHEVLPAGPVRLELGQVMPLLVAGNYAPTPRSAA
jgi:hypothetical protein